MNKSKFLKKSLAMVLAIMMVVAMIPLSASAAELPNLTKLYVGDNVVTVDENNVFKADISTSDTSVTIKLDEESLSTTEGQAKLYLVKDGSSNTEEIKLGSTDYQKKVEFKDWATETAGVVSFKLQVVSKDNTAKEVYTVALTRSAASLIAEVDTVTPDIGAYSADVDNDARTVDLVVAENALTKGVKFVVTTKEGGKVEKTTVDNYDPETGVIIVKADGRKFTVTSASGQNVAEYTVNVTEVDALTSFSVNGVKGVITDKNGDDVDDTITVTLPKSICYDELGYALSDVKMAVEYAAYGNSTTVSMTGDTDGVKTGDIFGFGDLHTYAENGTVMNNIDVTISCAGYTNLQKYNLVIDFEKSADTAITYAQIDDEIATIDGTNISAVLPVKKADGSTTKLSDTVVTLYTEASANVVAISGFQKAAKQEVAGKHVWYSAGSAAPQKYDLTSPRIITVKAENGTTTQYTISATIDDNKDEAYLTSMSLMNGSTEYVGEIKGNTIVFDDIPYMTKDISKWTVFATPNASAKVVNNKKTVISNGRSTASVLGFTAALSTEENKNVGKIIAVNKNDSAVFTEYTVIVNLVKPATGRTLTKLGVSALTTNPASLNNDKVAALVTEENDIEIAISDKGLVTGNTGKVTLKPAYSLSKNNSELKALYRVITEVATAEGGVPYIATVDGKNYSVYSLKVLESNKNRFASNNTMLGSTLVLNANLRIIVLPEEEARLVSADGTTVYGTANVGADVVTGTVYTIEEVADPASTQTALNSIKIGDTTLSISGDKITGTLPWSLTTGDGSPAEDVKDVSAKATFADFTISDYAVLSSSDAANTNRFVSLSDPAQDEKIGTDNQKFVFVRNDDHTVTVEVTRDGSATFKLTPANEVTVWAENRLTTSEASKMSYTFELKWEDPNTEAQLTSFKLANTAATISADRKVSVSVPFGTDVKGLIPTFTTSTGATVTVGGKEVVSGKTTLNFSNPVEFIVTSEDGQKTLNYTVTVKVAEQFSDVSSDDWFYEDVMTATANGWITGTGNGMFSPKSGMKRGDFALMITRVINADLSAYEGKTAFPDVPADKYYAAAVAYCYDNGIIGGYEDGKFYGERTIDRNAMAKIICSVKGLDQVTNPEKPFADDAKIPTWAKGYVYACAEAGIILGDNYNNFNGKNIAKRCEAAAVLVRAFA